MSAGYPWWTEPASWFGAQLLRLLGSSWRVERLGMAAQEARLASGSRCVFALWHARLLPLIFTHRGRGVAVLVSRHRDGQLVTRMVERLGYVTARGSSTRGGEEGLREMIGRAGEGRLLAITPDGPRGPAERLKPGLLYIAGRTGYPIVPVAAASAGAWRLRSWDGFRIPRPFAKVTVSYGEPIEVAPDLDGEGLDQVSAQVEAAIARLTAEMDERAGEAR